MSSCDHETTNLGCLKCYERNYNSNMINDENLLFEIKEKISTVSGGLKYDNEKPDLALLSPFAIERIAEVLTFGKKKYAAHNWRKGISYSRLLGALLRHTFSYLKGEDLDPESGLSHMAHAGCCVMFLLEMAHTRKDLDDRYKEVTHD